MGLFDELAGAAGSLLQGNAATGSGSPLAGSLLGLLGPGGAGGGAGGLQGILGALGKAGLGDVAGSWVGTGQNLPISPQQVQSALGGHVQQLAAQHGLSADVVSQAISQLLPGLVDHLTPNGQLPSGSGALEQGLSALRSKFGI